MPRSLTRSVQGLRVLHVRTADAVVGVTEPFVAGDWTPYNFGAGGPGVDGNGRLTFSKNGVSGDHYLLYDLIQQSDGVVMAVCDSVGGAGRTMVFLRRNAGASVTDAVRARIPKGFSAGYDLIDTAGGVTSGSSTSAAASRSTSASDRSLLAVEGTEAETRLEAPSGTSGAASSDLSLSAIDAAGDNPGVGFSTGTGSNITAIWRQWGLLRGRLLTVNGPTTGNWRIRLRNGAGTVILTSDVQVGGVATLDFLDNRDAWIGTTVTSLLSLAVQIEVYDDDLAEVMAGPETPTERLWGGDVWDIGREPWVSPTPQFPTTLPGLQVTLDRTPEYSTQILTAGSGQEYRTLERSRPRTRFGWTIELLRLSDVLPEWQSFIGLYQRLAGPYGTLVLEDPEDYLIPADAPMPFGIGDGVTTQFQLQRTLVPANVRSDPLELWPSVIDGFEPVRAFPDYPVLYIDEVEPGDLDWTLSETGLVTFATAPADGAVLTWTGAFLKRVRFADDRQATRRIVPLFNEAPRVEFLEVF